MVLKRHLCKTIACLSAGVFLLTANYPVAGCRIAGAAQEPSLERTTTKFVGKKPVAVEGVQDPAIGLAWLIDGLIARDPALKVKQSPRVIHNGQRTWIQIWLKGDTGNIEVLADFLELSRRTLNQNFNYHLLINSDPGHGSLRFLILDGFEVVVVANLTTRSFKPQPVPKDAHPQLAIVIDDLGQSLDIAAKFASLKLPLTFAIFPKLHNSRKVARYFVSRQCDIMLHMPMEPRDYPAQNPGPGALLMVMSRDQVKRVFIEDLDSLPGIIGVNNHMGSRLTTNPEKMNQVMAVLKGRGLFFLDSRTIAHSVAYKSAVTYGIPALQRDVFLDNERDVAKIIEQFRLLIEIARVKNRAIGIGHPYPETLDALGRFAGIAESAGVKIVAVRKFLPGLKTAFAR